MQRRETRETLKAAEVTEKSILGCEAMIRKKSLMQKEPVVCDGALYIMRAVAGELSMSRTMRMIDK